MSQAPEFVLTLSCPDRTGIVHAVSGFLAERGDNILDSQQFGDRDAGRFFMRVHFSSADVGGRDAHRALCADFAPVVEKFAMDWALHDLAVRPRVLVLVSKLGHCLNDLLYRHRIGALPGDIVGVVGNHDTLRSLAESAGVPFHHLPVTEETKAAQEKQLL
ncbi:MAG: ACT domain-containing protein, partial [Sciscionella sp.]|nr:ACT domain-containing protein [Sciscionella sp.]